MTAKEVLEAALRGEGCLGKAIAKDPNMPVFVLVATDAVADDAVERWAALARSMGCPNSDKLLQASQIAGRNADVSKQKGAGLMKRFLLFCGLRYYPSGGWEDFIGDFDTKQEAQAEGDRRMDSGCWGTWTYVVDTATGKICAQEQRLT